MAFHGNHRERFPRVLGALAVAFFVKGALLGGCGTTSPWPEMTPAELEPAGIDLRADVIYRAGPWSKTYAVVDAADRGTGARLIRRCSAPEPDGSWRLVTFEVPRKVSDRDPEERELQRVTLRANDDGGITLIALEDVAQSTRTTFDPPLVILPQRLEAAVPAEAESEAVVSSLGAEGSVLEHGRARLRTVFSADPDDAAAFRVRQTLRIELASSVIDRRTFHTGSRGAGITAENEELTVSVGPFTVMSKSRRLRLVLSDRVGAVR